MNEILLCSQSYSRRTLLLQSGIPFRHIPHHADESSCCWNQELERVVMDIAIHKMNHAIIPSNYTQNRAFIVTADTLGITEDGRLRGQPRNREEARVYIRENRGILTCATAFCIEERERLAHDWQTAQRHVECVIARLSFHVPDDAIEAYIDNTQALRASGAVCVEGYGAQFVQSVHGSYTAICGLPLHQLRVALIKMGFFAQKI